MRRHIAAVDSASPITVLPKVLDMPLREVHHQASLLGQPYPGPRARVPQLQAHPPEARDPAVSPRAAKRRGRPTAPALLPPPLWCSNRSPFYPKTQRSEKPRYRRRNQAREEPNSGDEGTAMEQYPSIVSTWNHGSRTLTSLLLLVVGCGREERARDVDDA
ncbi:hypothetical protein BHM03_00047643 [Ensete ventricosum]|nr:hypothetical protein BHM03_00047643 [Ensete ventricosum]